MDSVSTPQVPLATNRQRARGTIKIQILAPLVRSHLRTIPSVPHYLPGHRNDHARRGHSQSCQADAEATIPEHAPAAAFFRGCRTSGRRGLVLISALRLLAERHGRAATHNGAVSYHTCGAIWWCRSPSVRCLFHSDGLAREILHFGNVVVSADGRCRLAGRSANRPLARKLF